MPDAIAAAGTLTGRQAQIATAARALLDAEGSGALTMRRIADALGIKAPSLYKHVPDKTALEALVVAEGFAELGDVLEAAAADATAADATAANQADVEPYPVTLGTRYHDGKPDEPGKDWWGTVTGFQPPGSLDFHHTISVGRLWMTIDVHIHYSLEPKDGATEISRWLVLDFTLPTVFRPLRPLITARFDKENLRTMDALREYAKAHSSVSG